MIYPCGLAFDSDDRLYVCDSGNYRIQIFTENGQFLKTFGSRDIFVNKPIFVSVSEAGKVFVSDTKRYIKIFTGSGYEEVCKLYMNQPGGVAVDRFDHVVVADSGGHLVVIKETGEAVCKIASCGKGPGQLLQPKGVAITPQGHFVVCDPGSKLIQVFRVELNQHDEDV